MSCNSNNNQTSNSYKGSKEAIAPASYLSNIQQPTNSIVLPQNETTTIINDTRPWIDTFLLQNFQYGNRVVDTKNGIVDLSLIPQFLISSTPEQTQANATGYSVGCPIGLPGLEGIWQQYIRIEGQTAIQYVRNTQTGEKKSGKSWNFGIQDSAIASVDGSKIINPNHLLAKIALPISNYINTNSGHLANGKIALPVVYTGSLLKTIVEDKDIRAAIFPSLVTQKGLLFEYNPVTNATPIFKPESLDGLINVNVDGTTMRSAILGQAGQAGVNIGGAGQRPAGTVLTAYTYTDGVTLSGSGTPTDPIRAIKGGSANGTLTWFTSDNSVKTINTGNFTLVSTAGNNKNYKFTQNLPIAGITIQAGKTKVRLFIQANATVDYSETSLAQASINNQFVKASLSLVTDPYITFPGQNVQARVVQSGYIMPLGYSDRQDISLSLGREIEVDTSKITSLNLQLDVNVPADSVSPSVTTYENFFSVRFLEYV